MADLLQIVLVAIVMDAWKVRWSSPRLNGVGAAIVAPWFAAMLAADNFPQSLCRFPLALVVRAT